MESKRGSALFLDCHMGKYSKLTAPRVNMSLKKKKKKNGWLVMKIGDNGKGITETDLADSQSFGNLGIKERVEFMKGKSK